MARYDVVVIGAGAAGLTAAALLAKEGKRVCVVERPRTSAAAAWPCPRRASSSTSAGTCSRTPAPA